MPRATNKAIKREFIEKRLSDFCNVDQISNYLTEKQKSVLFKIALDFAVDSTLYEEAGNKALGVNVAKSVVRNYWLALLTANAISYLGKKGIKKPVILEMGMGSGLSAIAAFIINKNSYYIGVEIDNICINFACRQFMKYNVAKKVEIIKARYENVILNKKADIIINENLGPNLVEEEQVIASNAALACAKKSTLFVPMSMNIFCKHKKEVESKLISFDKRIPLKIDFFINIKKQKSDSFQIGCDIIDSSGNIAVSQKNNKDYISYLPLIGQKIPIKAKNKKNSKIKITLDFSAKQIIVG